MRRKSIIFEKFHTHEKLFARRQFGSLRYQLVRELRPGGELVYEMTATAPEQVEFMAQHGMPLTTESRKRFTEVASPTRLAYVSLVDFVPDHEPYEHLTVVDIEPDGSGSRVTMTIEPMHDAEWTNRLVAGRENELENLARATAPAQG